MDAFYRNQGTENSGYVTDDFLRGIAEATTGLDVERALADRDHPSTERAVARAEQLASKLGSESTPAFYMRRGDGPLQSVEPSDMTPDAFTAALDDALAAR